MQKIELLLDENEVSVRFEFDDIDSFETLLIKLVGGELDQQLIKAIYDELNENGYDEYADRLIKSLKNYLSEAVSTSCESNTYEMKSNDFKHWVRSVKNGP